ncbi:rec [Caudoviricetes sp.]|nr:rec [Caudoviricetes sp.]
MRPKITLSTGTTIYHLPMANGATEALVMGGGSMTDSEWSEYVATIAAINPKTIKAPKPTWEQIKARKML